MITVLLLHDAPLPVADPLDVVTDAAQRPQRASVRVWARLGRSSHQSIRMLEPNSLDVASNSYKTLLRKFLVLKVYYNS
jgi:hypothetical protein